MVHSFKKIKATPAGNASPKGVCYNSTCILIENPFSLQFPRAPHTIPCNLLFDSLVPCTLEMARATIAIAATIPIATGQHTIATVCHRYHGSHHRPRLSWHVLVSLGGSRGLSWGCLGAPLASPGPLLGLSLALPDRSWLPLGLSSAPWGGSWAALGRHLASLGPPFVGPWGQEAGRQQQSAPR